MIGLEDRIVLAQDIDTAHRNGARLERACAEVGITCSAGRLMTDRLPAIVGPGLSGQHPLMR